jgi:dTDP-4-amino-4,6-dideoxygalactose transaminase
MSNIQHIAKTAQMQARFRRSAFGFKSARDAFRSLLSAWDVTSEDSILLPSFIGWSAREGSGVFDPVASIGSEPIFYRMNESLFIDAEDVQCKIRERSPRVLVLIHYFGYPDPNAAALAAYARKHGVLVLEDEAHAMLSDLVGGACGRAGDAVIFSLHKMLPFSEGGVLLLNPSISDTVRMRIAGIESHGDLLSFWEYDLHCIATVRRRNAEQLIAALSPLAGRVNLLFPSLPPGVVPQTLPVIIQRKNRDELYFEMNAAGFGVVSLYHTLIDRVNAQEFPESHALASRIMNLPVHQDAEPEQLTAMIDKLRELA